MAYEQTMFKTSESRNVDPLINVRNLSVEFHTNAGTVRAVNEISLELRQSESLAILGESGSGKSTAAKAIMGLLPKPAGHIVGGEIFFQGQNLLKAKESVRRTMRGTQMSIIFQDPLSALNPVFTVGFQIGEAIRYHKSLPRKQVKRAVVELMERVKIPDARNRINNYPHQFSGGMQQRVMIAMALALNPKVIIADEPTTALDVTVQAQIMHLLEELKVEENMGLILISHDLGVVANYVDSVAVMYAGRIVEKGKVEEVFRNPAHPYTLGLMNSIPAVNKDSTRLTPIKGAPPNLINLSQGCPFQPRCPFSQDICKNENPTLTEVTQGRKSACHFSKGVLNNGYEFR
ncbi:ABC transporter ATP-binding protein [Bacillus sp. J14TS2]|uniref:ABC transporter ATP-binding protein n=1 Tax=Bacillus sp. J14TS2 TaxID=2807188 RepID=UPI001B0C51A1|nr:ABC transporter ATP-binding protein [Bacillus sp. J14TS2]GIN74847.1 ABC transporter ATP-binding protein [Bacillus sp. J14TS2]